MKISEVIKKLQEIQEEHGDVEVMVYNDPWCEGYFEPLTNGDIIFKNRDNKLYIEG